MFAIRKFCYIKNNVIPTTSIYRGLLYRGSALYPLKHLSWREKARRNVWLDQASNVMGSDVKPWSIQLCYELPIVYYNSLALLNSIFLEKRSMSSLFSLKKKTRLRRRKKKQISSTTHFVNLINTYFFSLRTWESHIILTAAREH